MHKLLTVLFFVLKKVLPLTAKQKYSMMASWKGISRAMEPTGVYMFIK
jgi:hypothetical protein